MGTILVSRASFSSRQLARRLGIKRKIVGKQRIPPVPSVINWGCSDIPGIYWGTTVLNHPAAVSAAVDKLAAFRRMRNVGIPTVDFTTSKEEANKWLKGGNTVFGRTLTRGSGGRGIELYITGRYAGEIGEAPLYTKFFKCDRELRVHVVGDQVIDFAEKRKVRLDNPPENRYWIRSRRNGWIYAREGARCTQKVKDICIAAIRALDLDFGAVDVRVRDGGETRVLEVNTAPGIVGTTLERYSAAFSRLI